MRRELQEGELTFHQFMVDWKVRRDKINGALQSLELNLPIESVGSNKTIIFSLAVQEQIRNQLKIIHPSRVCEFLEQGYTPSNKLEDALDIPNRSAQRFMRKLYPNWTSEFYTFPEGEKRVHLLPSYVIDNLRRYRDLSPARHQLSLWRAWRNSGKFNLPEDKETIDDWKRISITILESNDLLNLKEKDLAMLIQIVNPDLIRELFYNVMQNKSKKKNMHEVIAYAAYAIPKIATLISADSEFFTGILTRDVISFIQGEDPLFEG